MSKQRAKKWAVGSFSIAGGDEVWSCIEENGVEVSIRLRRVQAVIRQRTGEYPKNGIERAFACRIQLDGGVVTLSDRSGQAFRHAWMKWLKQP